MTHQDKFRSYVSGQTIVGFYKDCILDHKRSYNHSEKGEWARRVKEEEEWNKTDGQTTKYLNR